MADKKISQLDAATTPLSGAEVLPIVQSSTTKKVSVANLTASRAISATSISVGDGTVSAPSVTATSDTNTGVFFPAADTIAITAGGTEGMRVTSDRNVGVGTNNPLAGLHVSKAGGTYNVFGLLGSSTNLNTTLQSTNNVTVVSAEGNNNGLYIHRSATGGNNGFPAGFLLKPTNYDGFRNALTVSQLTHNTGSNTDLMRLSPYGDVISVTGNFIVGTAGKGIDFSAAGNAAGMTSELLADYEEGSYTATITPSTSGSVTLDSNTQTLTYVKIGSLVTVTGYISVSSVSSPTGYFSVSLPFAIASTGASTRSAPVISPDTLLSANINSLIGIAIQGASAFRVYLGTATSLSAASAQELFTGVGLHISFTYRAS